MSLLTSLSADVAQDRRELLRRYAAILAADAQTALAAIATAQTPGLDTTDPEDPSGEDVSRVTPHGSRASADASEREAGSKARTPIGKLKDLKHLMSRLNKAEPDVAHDLALIGRAARAHRFASLPGDHSARTVAAQKAVAAYDAETAKLVQSRRAEYFRLYNAACELQEQRTRANNARQELQRMKNANPDLLAHVTVPERS